MPIDPTRADELLAAAQAIPDAATRTAFLDRECDPALRPAVDAALAARAADAGTIDQPTDAETGTFGGQPADPKSATIDSHAPTAGPAVPRSARGPATGQLIAGRYQIVEAIGEGGMGAVYLARQSEPVKRDVALKLIRRGADSAQVVARFEAERQALALMDHPNIARVYDGGTTDRGEPYFVMELVHGVPITKYCDDHRLPPRDRLDLFVQVCRAVQHAHQKGIIHRDLKPGNILVTEVDGRPTTKVIDFGVAKAVNQQLTESAFTDDGVIVGTPAYMSPEQTDPATVDIDTRTDVYALGVVLYELLAGAPPITATDFRRAAILEMLRMVREVEPEHLSTKVSRVAELPAIAARRGLDPAQLLRILRGDVDWIVLKALAKDRERRYESANGMAADILRYLADEPVAARPPSRGYRLQKFVRRNRRGVVAAGVLLLAVLAGLAGVLWQWREAVHQRGLAEIARAEAVEAQGRAEANYKNAQEQRRVALDTVGNLVLRVRADIATRPDMQGTVRWVVQVARASLARIAQNPDVSVSLNDTTRALVHDLAARTARDQGDPSTAAKEFAQAAGAFEDILRAPTKAGDDPGWRDVVRKNLVVVRLGLGQINIATQGYEAARVEFEKAAAALDAVEDKSDAGYRRLLAALSINLGVATEEKKPREARENFRAALRMGEELANREVAAGGRPADETRELLRNAAAAAATAAGRLRDAKSWEDGSAKALELATALAADKPDDRGRKQSLAMAHERLADVRLRTGRPAEAANGYATAAKLLAELAAADPTSGDARRDRGRITYSQGLAALRVGDKDAAAKFFADSLAPRQSRPGLDADLTAQRDLMMSLARTGKTAEAIGWAEKVRAKQATEPGALLDIACCYAVCGDAGKAVEALKAAVAAGYRDKVNLETEPDLDPVRDRADFKALVAAVPEP